MIVEIHVTPQPSGDDRRPYAHVDAAITVVRDSGLHHEVGALGTTFEGPPDEVWSVLRRAHEACLASGAERVITHVRLADGAGDSVPSMDALVDPHRP